MSKMCVVRENFELRNCGNRISDLYTVYKMLCSINRTMGFTKIKMTIMSFGHLQPWVSHFYKLWVLHNQVPQNGWLKQQKCIFSQFWNLRVQDQGVDKIVFRWSITLTVFPGSSLCVSVCMVLPLFMRPVILD